jgi:hypothetical protein
MIDVMKKSMKFPCPVISFSNIIVNDKKEAAFTNEARELETATLLAHNKNYHNINFIDAGHCVFEHTHTVSIIIHGIRSMISKYA